MIKLFLIGRLTEDPVQKTINGANVVNFSIAANTTRKDDEGKYIPNFFRCSVWRGLGDTCMKFLHKGDRVSVVGKQSLQNYTDSNGNPRSALQVDVDDVEFLSEKKNAEGQAPAAKAHSYTAPAPVSEEDNLPF